MTPILLFQYSIAVAGGLFVIGLSAFVLLWLLGLYLAAAKAAQGGNTQ